MTLIHTKNHGKKHYGRAFVAITIVTFMTLCYHQYGMRQIEFDAPFYVEKNYNESELSADAINGGYVVWNPYCHIPNISAVHPTIAKIVGPWREISCSNKKLLTKLEYDDFRGEVRLEIVPEAVYSYTRDTKHIECCYQTVTRRWLPKKINKNDDDRFTLGSPKCFNNSIVLSRDVEFMLVYCSRSKSKTFYQTLHAVVVDKKPRVKVKKQEEKKYSVLLYGIDSISRLNMERSMPRTKEFLEQSGWTDLEGYNKIADNTFPNVVAMLTGRSYEQIVHHCFRNNSIPLDKCPFLWKNFSDMGYVTSYVEDEVFIGTFNYHKYGFINAPTDYYTRPWMVAGMQYLPKKKDGGMDYCLGQRTHAEYLFEYSTTFIQRMHDRPYFKFLWFNSFSHNEVNHVSVMDKRIRQMLEDIQPYLNSTFVIFLSDHGSRFGKIRETYVGWLEERLPYIYFWIPPTYRQKYLDKYSNLVANKNRLTTPYDVYVTLQEILYGKIIQPSVACPNCTSLFEKVNWNRSCEDVAIPPHWCTCSVAEQNEESAGNTEVIAAANEALDIMNSYVKKVKGEIKKTKECAVLDLKKVISVRTIARKSFRFFSSKELQYVIVFQVNPSQGIFEITWSPGSSLTVREISRINMYGEQSNCVLEDNDLKKICYCVDGTGISDSDLFTSVTHNYTNNQLVNHVFDHKLILVCLCISLLLF